MSLEERVAELERQVASLTMALAAAVKRIPPVKPKDCVHLGEALPGEVGTCKTKLRWCAVFGTCTYCPSDKTPHHCTDGKLAVACPQYEV